MRDYRQPGFMAIICIVLLLAFADSRADDTSCTSTEYKLMSMLINDEYETEFSLILINSDTEPWCIRGRLDVLKEEWPKLKNETIDSLIVINRGTTSRLAERFSIPVDYELVSMQEFVKVLGDGMTFKADGASVGTGLEQYASKSDAVEPDWNNFDKVFPDAQGYLTFSRVGFDSEHTQALVIFSNSYRCGGVRVTPGTRKIACFMKREGAWELVGVSRDFKMMY